MNDFYLLNEYFEIFSSDKKVTDKELLNIINFIKEILTIQPPSLQYRNKKMVGTKINGNNAMKCDNVTKDFG